MTKPSFFPDTSLGLVFHDGFGTFSIYSANASSIKLLIWNDDASQVLEELELNKEDEIFSVSHPSLVPGVKYTIRADGEAAPRNGFNPAIDLIDPYAKGVVRKSAREYYNVAMRDSFD